MLIYCVEVLPHGNPKVVVALQVASSIGEAKELHGQIS